MGPPDLPPRRGIYTLPIGLLNFIGMATDPKGTPWHLVMAVATVTMAPVIVIFFVAQKRFIEGIATTGMKG